MHGPRPTCAKCGLQMGLDRIKVIEQPDQDLRTFKCFHCVTEITEKVQYKCSNQPPQVG